MSNIGIEGKLKPLLQGGKVADAVDIETDSTHRFVSDTEKTKISNIPEKITDLTDTPSDMAFAGVRNVVANSLAQQIQFVIPYLNDMEDVDLDSIPVTGNILRYNGSHWIPDTERRAILYSAFTTTLNSDNISDAYINFVYVSDNQDVDIDLPDYPQDKDVLIIYNKNTEFDRYVDLSPVGSYKIDGKLLAYKIHHTSCVVFSYDKPTDNWVVMSVTDLATGSIAGGGIDLTDGSHTIHDVKLLTLSGATLTGTADNAVMTVTSGGSTPQPSDHTIIDGGTASSTFISDIDGGGASI